MRHQDGLLTKIFKGYKSGKNLKAAGDNMSDDSTLNKWVIKITVASRETFFFFLKGHWIYVIHFNLKGGAVSRWFVKGNVSAHFKMFHTLKQNIKYYHKKTKKEKHFPTMYTKFFISLSSYPTLCRKKQLTLET